MISTDNKTLASSTGHSEQLKKNVLINQLDQTIKQIQQQSKPTMLVSDKVKTEEFLHRQKHHESVHIIDLPIPELNNSTNELQSGNVKINPKLVLQNARELILSQNQKIQELHKIIESNQANKMQLLKLEKSDSTSTLEVIRNALIEKEQIKIERAKQEQKKLTESQRRSENWMNIAQERIESLNNKQKILLRKLDELGTIYHNHLIEGKEFQNQLSKLKIEDLSIFNQKFHEYENLLVYTDNYFLTVYKLVKKAMNKSLFENILDLSKDFNCNVEVLWGQICLNMLAIKPLCHYTGIYKLCIPKLKSLHEEILLKKDDINSKKKVHENKIKESQTGFFTSKKATPEHLKDIQKDINDFKKIFALLNNKAKVIEEIYAYSETTCKWEFDPLRKLFSTFCLDENRGRIFIQPQPDLEAKFTSLIQTAKDQRLQLWKDITDLVKKICIDLFKISIDVNQTIDAGATGYFDYKSMYDTTTYVGAIAGHATDYDQKYVSSVIPYNESSPPDITFEQ